VNNSTTLDYLVVANYAQIMDGMLNLIGGNFSDITRSGEDSTSALHNFSAAFSISIPWDSSNQLHSVTIRLENLDGTKVLGEAKASFSIGRLPKVTEDSEQHAIGVVQFSIIYPSPGYYQVKAIVDNGGDTRHWRFRVHDLGKEA